MRTESLSHKIATELAKIWQTHRSESFLIYLRDTYGADLSSNVQFDEMYIVEADYGDVNNGSIGSMTRRWWLVNDEGLRVVDYPSLPGAYFADDPELVRGAVYKKPIIKFYYEDWTITIGEEIGPRLQCRKIARMRETGEGVSLSDTKIVWIIDQF